MLDSYHTTNVKHELNLGILNRCKTAMKLSAPIPNPCKIFSLTVNPFQALNLNISKKNIYPLRTSHLTHFVNPS